MPRVFSCRHFEYQEIEVVSRSHNRPFLRQLEPFYYGEVATKSLHFICMLKAAKCISEIAY